MVWIWLKFLYLSLLYVSPVSPSVPTDHEHFSWLHLNLGGNAFVRNFWRNLRSFCRQSSRCQSCFVPRKSQRWRSRASHYCWRPSHQTQEKQNLSKHWWATLETYFTVTLSLCIFWFVLDAMMTCNLVSIWDLKNIAKFFFKEPSSVFFGSFEFISFRERRGEI